MIKKIGLQLYTIGSHFKTPEMASETFKKIKQLGYDEAQTAGCYGMDYDLFYNLAREQGIEIIGTHDDFDMMKHDIEKSIENHKKLHTTNMGIGGFYIRSEEEAAGFIMYANKIAERISKEGMKFTYHNHSHEFIKLPTGKTPMQLLTEGLDEKNISFVLDTCWVQNAGADVCTWIEKLKGRIDIIHLKDMEVVADPACGPKFNIAAVGKGNMDFDKIIDTCEKTGVKHYCIEMDNCPEDYEKTLEGISEFMHKKYM